MATTNFSGPLQTGQEVSGGATRGTPQVTQRVSISAEGAYAPVFLPDSHIVGFQVNIEDTFVTAGGTTNATIFFGVSADLDQYGQVSVSGPARYDVTNISGAALLSLAEGTRVVVSVSGPVTAGPAGKGSAYISYFQRDLNVSGDTPGIS